MGMAEGIQPAGPMADDIQSRYLHDTEAETWV